MIYYPKSEKTIDLVFINFKICQNNYMIWYLFLNTESGITTKTFSNTAKS